MVAITVNIEKIYERSGLCSYPNVHLPGRVGTEIFECWTLMA